MMLWAGEYVGIPYRFGAATREGADCWGLIRLVLAERFGRVIPDVPRLADDSVPGLIGEHREEYAPVRVESPEPGDLVLMYLRGQPHHIGIVVGAAGERNLLHTLRGHDSALDRYDGPRWAPLVEGFYRV